MMKLSDLIELFVERDSDPPRTAEPGLDDRRKDTSSLADIARILRELDGQHETDREARRIGHARPDEEVLRS
jgi:hypothetical protein